MWAAYVFLCICICNNINYVQFIIITFEIGFTQKTCKSKVILQIPYTKTWPKFSCVFWWSVACLLLLLLLLLTAVAQHLQHTSHRDLFMVQNEKSLCNKYSCRTCNKDHHQQQHNRTKGERGYFWSQGIFAIFDIKETLTHRRTFLCVRVYYYRNEFPCKLEC